MPRFFLRRLVFILGSLLVANFTGFAYAHLALYIHASRNPFFAPTEKPAPILSAYWLYLQKIFSLDFGTVRLGAGLPVSQAVSEALSASLGLMLLAFTLSLVLGLWVGFTAVRADPPRVAIWLAPLATMGLAMPSFYLGTLLIIGTLYYVILQPQATFSLPVAGFGWDTHLIFPVLALMLRPTVQIAQLTSGLLVGELNHRYIVTARAIGNTWETVQWKHALRNILAPVILNMAASFRFLVGELLAVEWLFSWPGLGRLLALMLITARLSNVPENVMFLHPSLLAATLTASAAIFLLADLISTMLARIVDPRLREI
jgi:peptide/nickel transport system permease protein